MRVFWYISNDKLDMLDCRGPSGVDTLTASLKVGIGVVSATAGATIRPPVSQSTIKMLERVEKLLAHDDSVRSVTDVSIGRLPKFFRYEGPTSRIIQDDIFWAASLVGTTAVLLVGAASNVPGSHDALERTYTISPSADPRGAALRAFANPEATGWELSYAWASIVGDTKVTGWDDLPYTAGICICAARQVAAQEQIREYNPDGKIKDLVIGSPIFVEQM